jgi:hypothetical protein
MDPETLNWWGWPAVVVVLGLVQVFKDVGFPVKYSALLAIAISVPLGVIAEVYKSDPLVIAGFGGLVAALVASGVWSAVKNKVQTEK